MLLAALLMPLLLSSGAMGLEGQLNVNSASLAEWQRLPFISATRARLLLRERQAGPFSSLEGIHRSQTVTPVIFKAIKPYLVLAGPSTLAQGPQGAAEAPSTPCALLTEREYFDTLVDFLRHADHRVEMAMFLFKITDSPRNRPAALVRELTEARTRGVEVHLVLERSGYDQRLTEENRRTADLLRRRGIGVRFDDPKTTMHCKIVVIDNRFVFLGSHNLTHAALTFNHETSLLLDSRPLARELSGYLTELTR